MDPFIGQIMMFGGGFAPRGWALCNGQLLDISNNAALFSILGTTYGGDGRTNFALPDLRSRFPMHVGSGPGLTKHNWGQKGGVETVTLSVNQMPAHSHTVSAVSTNGAVKIPTDALPAKVTGNIISPYKVAPSDTTMAAEMIQQTGGGQAVNTESPFLCINFVIALIGIFPSRN